MTIQQTLITLPEHYPVAALLAFHNRDREALSERVVDQTLYKGIDIDGPALLRFTIAANQVRVQFEGDGLDEPALHQLGRKILGLNQPIEQFEAEFINHPELGGQIAHNSGLRIPQAATPFEALSWAIIGQLISVAAAVAIRRRFIMLIGEKHPSGLYCFPSAQRTAMIDLEALRGIGLTQTKAQALLILSHALTEGTLVLPDCVDETNVLEFSSALQAVKGIGPWTVNYALLRGFDYLNGSLHGDVAVRRNLQRLLNSPEKLGPDFTAQWLAQFHPFKALAAAHLWAYEYLAGY